MRSVVRLATSVGILQGDSRTALDTKALTRDESTSGIAHRHLAEIVDSSDDAIISKDLDGNITSWNAAAERMFGYSAGEVLGRSIRAIIPEDRQHEEDHVISRIVAGQAVQHYETMRRRKDGSLVPISLTVSPIFDDNGRVIGASKIARDITEHVRLTKAAAYQAAIREKLNEVGTVVAASLDRTTILQRVTDLATTLTDAQYGAFFYNVVNKQSGESYMLYTLSGLQKEAFAELLQKRADVVAGRPFQGNRVVRLEDLTAGEQPRVPPADSGPAQVLVRSYLAVPVTAASGEVLGKLFFGHSQPGVFAEHHEQLASGVAVWAAVALENARLYLEAREADRLKDEFLAVLSHELRTPLNAIVGYARLLRGGVLQGDKAERGLETLERNASALTQIVEDILDISRIVSGKMRLDIDAVELPIVVHDAIATVQPAADAKGVFLQTAIDPRVGAVSGDADRLQQVVWNVLANAVKFTPRGGRVDVRVECTSSHVEVIVSDTGIGIRPEFLPYVFERFRQADPGPTRKTGGLGLGLSIVRHIVEMHGGSVHVTSDGENRGATFRVSLPLRAGSAEPYSAPRELRRGMPLIGAATLTGVRVMAVDEEGDALGLLKVALESAGAEVVTVSAASAALERIADVQPHAIVIDLALPDSDGFDLITRIRSSDDPAVRNVPAVALTEFSRSEDAAEALQRGFELHLAKPVDPGELVASVATLVRRGGKQR